ncbi:hypothetical protein [Nocardia sp. BMG111209]|uniref:hypothetical protein n=1 Tax=Nocardia sp. BMG111209 TaxID=1160137 RepID=UPI00036427E8|nr:hypothetical protein [Nocardia sp. BMG111209]
MRIATVLHAGVAVTGIALAGIAAVPTAAAAPLPAAPDVAPVPPGGLVTSFLHNQLVYCSIICPLLAQTGTTIAVTVQQAPGTFGAARQSGADPMRAFGVAAASVTGPTRVAAQESIVADGTEVAPRALNAFEVGVVGLLDIGGAAAGGPPAIDAAARTARADTFAALNAPIVPDPPPLAVPHDATQVAVVAAIDVGAAVIFPAFNEVLSGAFETTDAAAQELAATGDPGRAVAAGADTATAVRTAAGAIVTDAIAGANDRIRAAGGQSRSAAG